MAERMLLHSELLESHGITAFFTMRQSGVSPPPFDSLNLGAGLGDADSNIQGNMTKLLTAAKLKDSPHQARQEHGIASLYCSGPGRLHHQAADILFTQESDCAVSVRTADCTPILLADPEAGVVAAVHAGWRGTAKQIVRHAIAIMQSHGSRPERILASLGPCIGPCCFSIGDETAAALMASCEGAEQYIHENTADLTSISALQLHQSGLQKAHIEQTRACTACDERRFFSYRRDGDQSGRHLAIVALPEAP